jgi:hypothetical protein
MSGAGTGIPASIPSMLQGFGSFAATVENWLVDRAFKVTSSDWTLFSGVPTNPLSPLSDEPTEDFKLKYLATANGTVLVSGSLDGVAKVEGPLTLAAGILRVGSTTFDTISSIACTCATGTITVTCINGSGKTIQHETLELLSIKWEDYTKRWQDSTQTDARVLVMDNTLKDGDTIRFNRNAPTIPTGGEDYIIMQYRSRKDKDGNYLFSVIYI